MALFFFYGTLKVGGANHHQLPPHRHLGAARVRGRLWVPRHGLYPFFQLPMEGQADTGWHMVEGELVELTGTPDEIQAAVQHLDAFESTTRGMYRRATVQVHRQGQPTVSAWTYAAQAVEPGWRLWPKPSWP